MKEFLYSALHNFVNLDKNEYDGLKIVRTLFKN